MADEENYSIDELAGQLHKFIGKIVTVKGMLFGYEMGSGLLQWPVELKIKGDEYMLTAHCKVSRLKGEHNRLSPYLSAYLGKEIGLKLYASNRFEILEIYLEDTTFIRNLE